MEGDGSAWIDYRGPPDTFRNVSFSRVLRGKVPDSVFRGKTVVIGATAPSLQDLHATSTTGDELMSGPEIQANAIWTADHGFPLSSSALVARPAADPAAGRRAGRRDAAPEAAPGARSSRSRLGLALRRRRPARLRRRHRAAGRLPAAGAGRSRPSARSPSTTCSPASSASASTTPSPASSPRRWSPTCSTGSTRGPAPRRRAARVHRPVQRPARLHQLRRGAARRTG